MIDVSVTMAATPSFVQTLKTHERFLAAATSREQVKSRKYSSLAARSNMRCVPFVVESFGAMGKQAESFLRELSQETAEPHQFYIYALRRVAIVLQRGNAKVQRQGQLQDMVRRGALREAACRPRVS